MCTDDNSGKCGIELEGWNAACILSFQNLGILLTLLACHSKHWLNTQTDSESHWYPQWKHLIWQEVQNIIDKLFFKISICWSNWLEYVFSWEMTPKQWKNTKAHCSFDEFVNTLCTCMNSMFIPAYARLIRSNTLMDTNRHTAWMNAVLSTNLWSGAH